MNDLSPIAYDLKKIGEKSYGAVCNAFALYKNDYIDIKEYQKICDEIYLSVKNEWRNYLVQVTKKAGDAENSK